MTVEMGMAVTVTAATVVLGKEPEKEPEKDTISPTTRI